MNFTEIADGDPGGSLESAFATMSTETVSSTKPKRITDLDMARMLGFAPANAILDGIQAAIDAGHLPQRVMRWIENEGLDVNDPQVAFVLGALVSQSHLEQEQVDSVLLLGREPKYPELQQQHIEKARRLRGEGKA